MKYIKTIEQLNEGKLNIQNTYKGEHSNKDETDFKERSEFKERSKKLLSPLLNILSN
jgi:hypothetical protein